MRVDGCCDAGAAVGCCLLHSIFQLPARHCFDVLLLKHTIMQVGDKVSLCLARTIYKDGTAETGKYDKVRASKGWAGAEVSQ